MTNLSKDQHAASVCHLETVGRISGNPHVIEIWFAAAGDVIWLPEGTPIKYEGDKAVVFYALDPVDWRRRHGIT